MVWYERLCRGGRLKNERFSLNEPMGTITTVGVSGAGAGGGDWYFLRDGRSEPMGERKPDEAKPPYRIPLMEEIRKTRRNGYSVVSTFSGCGGSCLGFEMAGFRILWANEFIEAARETYAANHPGVILDARDIRKVKPEEILKTIGKRRGEVDVMEGSPPCASFSTAGRRSAHWGQVKVYSETKQRTDDLFFELIRLVDGIQPRVFVAENVSGLVKGVAKGYFLEILSRLKACGYRVRCKVLDAQWLGVPQMRQRTIFIGVRADLGIEPEFPVPLSYRYSVRDALPWILRTPALLPGKVPSSRSAASPSATVTTSDIGGVTTRFNVVEAEADISRFAIGKEWEKLRPGEQSAKYMSLVKADPERPSPTVTQTGNCTSAASVVHPTEKRKFTIVELRRICAFPDDFVLTGSYAQQWERLGRAVPPLMMRAVALSVLEVLRKARRESPWKPKT